MLESHAPEQPIWAPFGVLTPAADHSTDSVQVGDTAEVKSGSHEGFSGRITQVNRLAGTLNIIGLHSPFRGRQVEVPLTCVDFTPDHRALRFTADRGYDVRQGDPVVVVRGDFIGKSGMVTQVNLDRKTLDVASTFNPSVCLILGSAHN